MTTLTIEAGREMFEIKIDQSNMSYTVWLDGKDVSFETTFGQRSTIIKAVQEWYLANGK